MERTRASVVHSLRRLGAHPRLLPLTALLLRARTVRPSAAFVVRESIGRDGLSTYRLRHNGLRVAIRHGTGDVVTLGEVFHESDYRPPSEIERALTADVKRIVDLGANVGLFGAYAASRWPQAQILAFEPDPANAAIHERTIAINGLQRRWQLVRAVAAAHDGRAAFVAGDAALSHVADAGEQRDTIEALVEDVLPRVAGADLLKMDIEGGEWAILGDPRFRREPPRALVMEYHPRFCPQPDPARAAERALREAGMQLRPIWERDDGHGMLWAWRA